QALQDRRGGLAQPRALGRVRRGGGGRVRADVDRLRAVDGDRRQSKMERAHSRAARGAQGARPRIKKRPGTAPAFSKPKTNVAYFFSSFFSSFLSAFFSAFLSAFFSVLAGSPSARATVHEAGSSTARAIRIERTSVIGRLLIEVLRGGARRKRSRMRAKPRQPPEAHEIMIESTRRDDRPILIECGGLAPMAAAHEA